MPVSGGEHLSAAEVSAAVGELGWRLVLGALCTTVPVSTLEQAATVAARIVAAGGADADRIMNVDLRTAQLLLSLYADPLTGREIDVARRVTAAVEELDLATTPTAGPRAPQLLEIAIDAMDIAAIRPFWKAVTGYTDKGGQPSTEDAIVDPGGQGPAIWFQQMSERRPERNCIHLDVSLPHDEASRRVEAALAAGGVLRSDAAAPAFWVLADAEGNEACISTWQGRD